MKKIKAGVITVIVLLTTFGNSLCSEAASMDSDVGITFSTSTHLGSIGGGKLPKTGELTLGILSLLGLLIIAYVLYRYWKQKRQEAIR